MKKLLLMLLFVLPSVSYASPDILENLASATLSILPDESALSAMNWVVPSTQPQSPLNLPPIAANSKITYRGAQEWIEGAIETPHFRKELSVTNINTDGSFHTDYDSTWWMNFLDHLIYPKHTFMHLDMAATSRIWAESLLESTNCVTAGGALENVAIGRQIVPSCRIDRDPIPTVEHVISEHDSFYMIAGYPFAAKVTLRLVIDTYLLPITTNFEIVPLSEK